MVPALHLYWGNHKPWESFCDIFAVYILRPLLFKISLVPTACLFTAQAGYERKTKTDPRKLLDICKVELSVGPWPTSIS
jgi:hypothetical protein